MPFNVKICDVREKIKKVEIFIFKEFYSSNILFFAHLFVYVLTYHIYISENWANIFYILPVLKIICRI